MTKALTAASVARLRETEDRVREIPDGGCVGLYLQIYPSGRKSWALRYRRPSDGRPAKLTLGSVFIAGNRSEVDVKPAVGGHLSLGAAHRLVAELKHEIALGRDPGKAHIEQKRKILTSDKFRGAALDFVEQHARRKTRRWQDTARLLGLQPKEDGDGFETIRKGLAYRWQDKPIAEIDGDLVHAIVEETREKGIPGLGRHRKEPSESRARSMFAALSARFGWLIAKRRLRHNPCVGVTRPETPKARERVLTNDEIIKFWRATDKATEPFGQLLKLLLLTGSRLNEVAGMRRGELAEDGQTWTIPGERTKNHKTHVVPLPKIAADILTTVDTDGDIVFTTNGKTVVSGWSKTKRRLDDAMGIPPWRLHDLRRTCATGMAEIGIAPHIVEACLNHISGAKAGVAGVYNRAAYAAEKKVALERWAAHVYGLVSGRKGNITSIRRGA
jgi:integrase